MVWPIAPLPRGISVHVDVDRLPAAYWAIRPKAAPGVDGVTWQVYGQDLEQNLVA